MGKKAKQKEKKRHLRPPLTFLDKSIYFLCIVLSCLGMMLLVFCLNDIKGMIAFSNPEAIAYQSHASFLFALPFIILLEIGAFVIFISGWESKKPIFGSKKYNYGEYPFDEECVPVFSRKKRARATPAKKAFRRKIIIIWCLLLILLASLIPLSLFGRDVMKKDNSIEKINLVNATSKAYSVNDFSKLTIQAKYVSGHKTASYWKYEIIIEMKDGNDFTFSNRDFDWRVSGAKDKCLDKMLEIKGLFSPDAVTVEGADKIDKVSDFLGLNEQQRAKLQALFSL